MVLFNTSQSLTDEQKAVVEAPENILTVTAYAGTGKTSTLKAFAQARAKESMLYLAFNRSMAEEARASFSSQTNVEVRTIHSLAFQQCGRPYKNKLGSLRAIDIIPFIQSLNIPRQNLYLVAKVILEAYYDWLISSQSTPLAFFKSYKPRLTAIANLNKLKIGEIIKAVEALWQASIDGSLPMPHNGYLKLFQLSDKRCLKYFDRILIDEAQDLNDCMIDVVVNNQSKKVLVGDPYQQIYAFNGAVNAIKKTVENGAARYYLTKSFRCPAKVATIANQYLKLLEAPKPFSSAVTDANSRKRVSNPPSMLIIARTNAGIFDFVATNNNILGKVYYFGGFDSYDFGTILDIVKLGIGEIDTIKDSLVKRFKNMDELEEYSGGVNDVATNTRIKIAKRYNRRVFTIYKEMVKNVGRNTYDSNLLVSTAHKIKGQEHVEVALLDDFASVKTIVETALAIQKSKGNNESNFSPPPFRLSLEELRLLYVSITRSKHKLEIPPKYHLDDELIKKFTFLKQQGFVDVRDEAGTL
ncbi:MAG: AAA family ATPase [Deltaproteobacteria bacterium]|jgi:superfamily I DNA/RNA helicase|nr:AAA family ATPase [Deltaproteobacteria bacterium]